MTNNKNRKTSQSAKQAPEKPVFNLLTPESSGPYIEKSSGWVYMIPILIFAAFIILVVRMHVYYRPMGMFFWTSQNGDTQMTEFFSYNKMIMIIVTGCLTAVFILFRILAHSIELKKNFIYIPMFVYCALVMLSYICSDYKEFSLLGYNERFEGTIPLLCYMLMLLYIINTINSEKNVKQVIWAIAIASAGLCLLGITQSIGHDFFQTEIGQKMISPNYALEGGSSIWQEISSEFAEGRTFWEFAFQNNEIYQTVFNPNYVSFYLTLLIPIWGMLFIRAFREDAGEKLWKKIALALLFGLCLYNLIGSKSAGGYIGIAIVGILGIVIVNKQLLSMWKPLVILFGVAAVVLGLTVNTWLPEFTGSVRGVVGGGSQTEVAADGTESDEAVDPASVKPIKYFHCLRRNRHFRNFSCFIASSLFGYAEADNARIEIYPMPTHRKKLLRTARNVCKQL